VYIDRTLRDSSCTYELEDGSLNCHRTNGMISIHSSPPKQQIINNNHNKWIYTQYDIESDNIFERLSYTCMQQKDQLGQVQTKSVIVMNSDQLLLHLSSKEGMNDDWMAKNAKVYSPVVSSLEKHIPTLPFSIKANKIVYEGSDLQLSGAKLCLGEKLVVPYLTKHVCLNGLPFGNFQIGYQLLDMDGWYITVSSPPSLFKNILWNVWLSTCALSFVETFDEAIVVCQSSSTSSCSYTCSVISTTTKET